MNKIISFALWGDDSMYVYGAYSNLRRASELLPDWKCRFYCGSDVRPEVLNRLADSGAEIIIIEKEHDRACRLWRLQVVLDNNVDMFIIRDCDSRLVARDCEAIRAWEKSGKDFHIMRDHKLHTAPIMGGMWGAKRTAVKYFYSKYNSKVKKIEGGHTPSRRLGKSALGDQIFLKEEVYPLITKENSLIHVGAGKREDFAINFPSKLKHPHHFVGQIYTMNDKPVVLK